MAKGDYEQGPFAPTNPEKYKGNIKNIVYRSGWEKRVMKWLDTNPSVLRWSSEEIIIPYRSPVDNRLHRYFVDFYVETRAKDGSVKVYIIEVKPQKQTQLPKKPKRQTKRYITEVMTYGVNQAKWDAARDYARHKGWEFKILTEKGYQDHI
jgi:hypothetical protein